MYKFLNKVPFKLTLHSCVMIEIKEGEKKRKRKRKKKKKNVKRKQAF